MKILSSNFIVSPISIGNKGSMFIEDLIVENSISRFYPFFSVERGYLNINQISFKNNSGLEEILLKVENSGEIKIENCEIESNIGKVLMSVTSGAFIDIDQCLI